MAPLTITDEYLAQLREKFEKWAEFLNIGFGLVAFTLGLACLGTNMPVVNAWFSIAVLFCIWFKSKHIFPKDIIQLRKLAKDDLKAKILLKGLESEFLSIKAVVTTCPVFLIGYALLAVIAFSPILSEVFPGLNAYIGP